MSDRMSLAPASLNDAGTTGRRKRTLVAVSIGNFMEWFDFAVYGYVAVTIGVLFFPSDNATTSLLASLAAFGIAFLARPLGGIVLGALADRRGRRPALVLVVALMGVATALIGVLPTYEQIGWLAPAALLLLRCAQGFSTGGEVTGASAYLIENAPTNRRGLWATVITIGAALGGVAGSLLVLALMSALSPADFEAFGWRIPFLIAAPMAVIAWLVRSRLDESPVFSEMEASGETRLPVRRRLNRADFKIAVVIFVMASVNGLGFYYLATYFNVFLVNVAEVSSGTALMTTVIGLVIYSLTLPVVGAISDRIGRRRTYLIGVSGLVLLTVPVFFLLTTGNPVLALIGMFVFGISVASTNGLIAVFLVELTRAETRGTTAGIGFNMGFALVAGPGPFVATWLVSVTGNPLAPAFYISAVALVVTIVMAFVLRDTTGRDISK